MFIYWVMSASGVGLLAALVFQQRLLAFFALGVGSVPSIYGPFDPNGAFTELVVALVHGIAVSAVVLSLFLVRRHRPALASSLLIVLTTIDLALANRGLILSVPQRMFETTPELLGAIKEAEARDPSPGPYRVYRLPQWVPDEWSLRPNRQRTSEVVGWARDTLEPKYGINLGVEYAYTKSGAELYDYEFFFAPFLVPNGVRQAELVEKLSDQPSPGPSLMYYPRRSLDLWNVRYFVVPKDAHGWAGEDRGYASMLVDSEPIPLGEGVEDGLDVQLFRNRSFFPRAWIVHEARFVKPIMGLDRFDRQDVMREILYQNDGFWSNPEWPVFDPKTTAWLESDDVNTLKRFSAGGAVSQNESVGIVKSEPQYVELEAVLGRPGFVILSDVFDLGWKLSVDGREQPMIRANRLMRAAAVGAGKHRIVYTYRPDSFRMGVRISTCSSVAAALAVVGLRVFGRFRRRRPSETLA